KGRWQCEECGQVVRQWTGQCRTCEAWNSITERACDTLGGESSAMSIASPCRLDEIEEGSLVRETTGLALWDQVIGGGLVKGSLTLIAGEPGIGKSTLLLQLAAAYASEHRKVLYVCGEESLEQTALRAQRLGIASSHLYLLNETLFGHIQKRVEELHPDLLIIDSIQIIYRGDLPSSPGSVNQVKSLAMESMHLAKRRGMSTLLVGHVTKGGEIAGPRVLEHIVDTVLEFEGEHAQGYRLLRSVKNRFGPTDEVALFQMTTGGLVEVEEVGAAYHGDSADAIGSVIVPTLLGNRCRLIELQALVAPSSFSTPSRRSTGLDPKRLSLLLAVLEKKRGYRLHTLDVFVSVAGGLTITEPAIDLGVILALASSYCSQALPRGVVAMGEVGLGGELRSIPHIERRLKEAHQRGFSRAVIPIKNREEALPLSGMEILPVSHVKEAIEGLLSIRDP
ncbi:MAG: DNA repair protein RadA, partial [Chlamydiota bacterium]|nr:DNA repair protein RadA [Chlamydiota bacterium]